MLILNNTVKSVYVVQRHATRFYFIMTNIIHKDY